MLSRPFQLPYESKFHPYGACDTTHRSLTFTKGDHEAINDHESKAKEGWQNVTVHVPGTRTWKGKGEERSSGSGVEFSFLQGGPWELCRFMER